MLWYSLDAHRWGASNGIRTKSLPDKIPSAHFCIGGHNPSHVFCNVDIITPPPPPPPPPLFFTRWTKSLPWIFQLGQNPPGWNPLRLSRPIRVLPGHLLLGYYFILFLKCGQGLKLHQQLLGGSSFLHWLFPAIASSSSENSNKTAQPQFLGPSLPFK